MPDQLINTRYQCYAKSEFAYNHDQQHQLASNSMWFRYKTMRHTIFSHTLNGKEQLKTGTWTFDKEKTQDHHTGTTLPTTWVTINIMCRFPADAPQKNTSIVHYTWQARTTWHLWHFSKRDQAGECRNKGRRTRAATPPPADLVNHHVSYHQSINTPYINTAKKIISVGCCNKWA
jgi:hypothetical protein